MFKIGQNVPSRGQNVPPGGQNVPPTVQNDIPCDELTKKYVFKSQIFYFFHKSKMRGYIYDYKSLHFYFFSIDLNLNISTFLKVEFFLFFP